MSIDRLLRPVRDDNQFVIGAEWGQCRTAFGGATAGVMCQTVLSFPTSGKSLMSFSLTLCAPVDVEDVIEIRVEPLRLGKTLEQYSIKAIQAGQICAHAIAVFGVKIDSSINISADPAPIFPSAKDGLSKPFAIGVNPRFAENFDIKFYEGEPLYSSSKDRSHLVGLEFKDPPTVSNIAQLVCLMDACPPTQAQQLNSYSPLSTVVWNMHFLRQASKFETREGIIMSSLGEASVDGSNYLSERVWSVDGTPLAFSTQSVLIFG